DERLAVQLLELGEARAVDYACDDPARVDLRPVIVGDEAVELARVRGGRLGLDDVPRWSGLREMQVAHDLSDDRERVLVVRRVVVRDAGATRGHAGAAERPRRHSA